MNGAYLSVFRFFVDVVLVYVYINAIPCLATFGRANPEDFGLTIAVACLVGLDAVCAVFSAVEGGGNLLAVVIHPACLIALLLGGRAHWYYRDLLHMGVLCVLSAVPPLLSAFMQVFYRFMSKARWD